MHSVFADYSPITCFIYFLTVSLTVMFINNPLILSISFITAFIYSIYLGGKNTLNLLIKTILPVFLTITIINPLFNHEGATILLYLPDGNPLTFESLIYGVVSAFLLSSVILIFFCFNKILTSDKVIYLFGRITPTLSLLISIILRFIPKFSSQFKKVKSSQYCIGKGVKNGNIIQKIKNCVRIISIMILWSMENSIQTADSMKNRGYGLQHRTSYSNYKFEKRDIIFIIFLTIFSLIIIFGLFNGYLEFYYFPVISNISNDIYSITLYIIYLILCLMPLILDIREDRKWKYIQSKI